MSSPEPTPAPSPLRCLGGDAAPAELIDDALLAAGFPKAAQRSVWTLLVPALAARPPADLDERVIAFAREHAVDATELARALRAHRFLLRRAALLRLPKEIYAGDLVALAGGELPGRRLFEMVAPGYDLGIAAVERELVGAALTAHGSLLEAVSWRLDEMILSDDGPIGRARVGVMTLSYRTGTREDRLTLQLLPEELGALEAACRAMLGKPREDER
jgi:hypothetical protein